MTVKTIFSIHFFVVPLRSQFVGSLVFVCKIRLQLWDDAAAQSGKRCPVLQQETCSGDRVEYLGWQRRNSSLAAIPPGSCRPFWFPGSHGTLRCLRSPRCAGSDANETDVLLRCQKEDQGGRFTLHLTSECSRGVADF